MHERQTPEDPPTEEQAVPDVLDTQDIREIRLSLEQIKHGETMDWVGFSAAFRARIDS